MPSKQSSRRTRAKTLAQLRAEYMGRPMSLEAGAYDAIIQTLIQGGDGFEAELKAVVSPSEPMAGMPIVDGVAIIPVTGVLTNSDPWWDETSYAGLQAALAEANGNPDVKGVMLYVDSPGGSAMGAASTAAAIAAVARVKPTAAFVGGMAASAGYYLASATGRIFAEQDAALGSIGAVIYHFDVSKMAQEAGVKVTPIVNADSPVKTHGNRFEPLTDESKATLQGFVESYAEQFISDVAAYRGVGAERVKAEFGKGDLYHAKKAVQRGMADRIVNGISEAIQLVRADVAAASKGGSDVTAKIKSQLFVMGAIDSPSVEDSVAEAALVNLGVDGKQPEATILAELQKPKEQPKEPPAANVAAAHAAEFNEARREAQAAERDRLANLQASAHLVNAAASAARVTVEMVAASFVAGHAPQEAMKAWQAILAKEEQPVTIQHVASGRDAFVSDAIEAGVYNAHGGRDSRGNQLPLKPGAANLVNMPLWGVALQCLDSAGVRVADRYDRESIAEAALDMGGTKKFRLSALGEASRFVQASTPAQRPGDFPNILSGIGNKLLDELMLADDYSYSRISAVWPGGLKDFRPSPIVSKGTAEELEVIKESDSIKQLGLTEETLSYVYLQRYAGKWGWTVEMIANDDMAAFTEQAIGIAQTWMTTQNRLVLNILTSNPTLLDGTALYSTVAGSGSNDRTSGATPSDSEWAAMDVLYAAFTGIGTARKVGGSLDTILVPTGTALHDARRTFEPFGMETKVAATTANIGLWRGRVNVVADSELNGNSLVKYYGFRTPTSLPTATIVRAYSQGYGEQGKRESWYDPERKTQWVSIEGRVGVAAKSRRFSVRNAGA